MAGCLDGCLVLELARFQAGPRAGQLLSDLGAEVIKIERPGGEETRGVAPVVGGESLYFATYNRGKKSICLDLRDSEDRAIFLELLARADFVIENFRPGTMERMGLGYDELVKIKPDIILVRASAFGQYGPHRDKVGFDPIGQALCGLMALTGQTEGKPIGTAFSLIDRITSLHATIGALAALQHRNRTGEGQVVDVCLMDAALTMVEIPLSYFLKTGKEGGEGGRPPLKAQDGWVVIAAGTPEMQRKMFAAIGAEAPTDDPVSAMLSGHPSRNSLADWCARHSVAEICELLENIGVPVAPVLSIPQVAEDPHLWEREMLVPFDGGDGTPTHVPGLAIKFSKTAGKLGPVPAPGAHTDEVLRDVLGYSEEQRSQVARRTARAPA